MNVGPRDLLGRLRVCSARTVDSRVKDIDLRLGFRPSSFHRPFADVHAVSVKRGTWSGSVLS